MSKLLYSDARMDAAIEFCWETQRTLSRAKFEGWGPARERAAIEMRKQLWRRFPAAIRTEAHYIFMGELNEQLGKPEEQRNPNKPVWINERLGWTHNAGGEPDRSGNPNPDKSPIITARN